MSTRLFDVLAHVAELLDDLGYNWALVGGLAVSAYVEPRFTRDIDIAVSVCDDDGAEDVVRSWQDAGFSISDVIEQDATSRLATVRSHLPGEEHGVVVDLIFASSGIEPELAARARRLELAEDLQIPVARPGHLVALKLLAVDEQARPQDRIDLEQLADILDEAEREAAEDAVALIEQRGYARGRNLTRRLEEYVTGD